MVIFVFIRYFLLLKIRALECEIESEGAKVSVSVCVAMYRLNRLEAAKKHKQKYTITQSTTP